MKKLFVIVSAIASIAGGELIARALFHVTGPDDIVTACCVMVAVAIGSAYYILGGIPEEIAVKAPIVQKEKEVIPEPFTEAEAKLFMFEYELARQDLERRQ